MQAHLRSHLPRLLISLRLLLGADNFTSLGIALDGRRVFTLRLIGLLKSGLHVSGKGQLPYEWQESLPAEDRAEDLFRVDETTLRSALLGSEFIILVPELGVGKRLVGNGDRLEALFRVWIVAVLVRVAFDREAAYTRPVITWSRRNGYLIDARYAFLISSAVASTGTPSRS